MPKYDELVPTLALARFDRPNEQEVEEKELTDIERMRRLCRRSSESLWPHFSLPEVSLTKLDRRDHRTHRCSSPAAPCTERMVGSPSPPQSLPPVPRMRPIRFRANRRPRSRRDRVPLSI